MSDQEDNGSGSILSSSAVMAAGTVVSRLSGFVRNALLAAALGTQLHADVFTIANTVPNMLYILLAGGVFNAVLVPQLVRAMPAGSYLVLTHSTAEIHGEPMLRVMNMHRDAAYAIDRDHCPEELWRAAADRCDATSSYVTMLRPVTEVVGSKQTYYGGMGAGSDQGAVTRTAASYTAGRSSMGKGASPSSAAAACRSRSAPRCSSCRSPSSGPAAGSTVRCCDARSCCSAWARCRASWAGSWCGAASSIGPA